MEKSIDQFNVHTYEAKVFDTLAFTKRSTRWQQ